MRKCFCLFKKVFTDTTLSHYFWFSFEDWFISKSELERKDRQKVRSRQMFSTARARPASSRTQGHRPSSTACQAHSRELDQTQSSQLRNPPTGAKWDASTSGGTFTHLISECILNVACSQSLKLHREFSKWEVKTTVCQEYRPRAVSNNQWKRSQFCSYIANFLKAYLFLIWKADFLEREGDTE